MASVRSIKKDIDFLTQEVVTDSYLAMYFHPQKEAEIIKLLEEAVALRNALIGRANAPAEKKNPRLVRKHYAQLRRDMADGIEELFQKLSDLNKS